MIDGKQEGPLSRAEVGIELASGDLDGESYVWREGMAGWVPAGKVGELAGLFATQDAPAPVPPPLPPGALQPRGAKGEVRPLESKPKKQEAGKGMREFDTGHFRLSDLDGHDAAPTKSSGGGGSKLSEFDTSHFRLADLYAGREAPDPAKLTLQLDGPVYTPGVVGYVDPLSPTAPATSRAKPAPGAAPKPQVEVKLVSRAAKPLPQPRAPAAAPRAAKKPAPAAVPFDPNRTMTDELPLGEQVHQAHLAKELFEAGLSGAFHAADLADWASSELSASAAASAPAAAKPRPVSAPPPAGAAKAPTNGKAARPKSAPPSEAAPQKPRPAAAAPASEVAHGGGSPAIAALVAGGVFLVIAILWLLLR